jgi:hypothetical protein
MTFMTLTMMIMMPSMHDGGASAPPMRMTKAGNDAPALAGVSPPPHTTLANMDITVKPRPHGEPAVYELRSPRSAATFASQYAANAKRAGFQVVTKGRVVVGIRNDGTSIRLHVIETERGSKAILTVKPPTNDRA